MNHPGDKQITSHNNDVQHLKRSFHKIVVY
uniref:Uncharacterized protein n=1 Tax=Rhizophora mucronata TaxID=61149 RepID=A0A2P2MXZ7_RHIMU